MIIVQGSPWHAKDIEKLENVQRKFVRNVSGLQSTTYEFTISI